MLYFYQGNLILNLNYKDLNVRATKKSLPSKNSPQIRREFPAITDAPLFTAHSVCMPAGSATLYFLRTVRLPQSVPSIHSCSFVLSLSLSLSSLLYLSFSFSFPQFNGCARVSDCTLQVWPHAWNAVCWKAADFCACVRTHTYKLSYSHLPCNPLGPDARSSLTCGASISRTCNGEIEIDTMLLS